ncbi:hypothetical protein PG999_013987 [Apiospora kogelbergensis]|uniref:Hydrophobin n=1 Tax=Apiospora kogelbergensis TaxID=1337665 RepID=A0AAW0QGZ1_9PEZI
MASSFPAGLLVPKPLRTPHPEPGLLSGLTDATKTLLGNLGNTPPPKLLWTPRPSPQCAAVNGGELQCCRGALAGDQPLVVFLAGVYGYQLNPNDVNGLVCDDQLDKCPGVKLCCQVTALSPLLSLYCQDY